MTLAQILFIISLSIIGNWLGNKLAAYYFNRKAKKLYNNIACQVNDLDINNSTKGE